MTVDSRRIAPESNYPSLRISDLEDVGLPIPPLPVQERIVQILQKADEIRRKRQEAIEIAETILPAAFFDMFGDAGEALDRFGSEPLGKLADVRSGVTKGRKLADKDTVEVPYLRVANVQDGYLDISEIKTIKVLPTDVEKYHLEDGDVLMTEGGDPDKLGRGCIWRNEIEGCIHQNHVFRVRTNRSRLLPEYLSALLRTQYAKTYFLSCAKRTSNLASVNSTQVKAFLVPTPPIESQQKFVLAVDHWNQAVSRLTTGYKNAIKMLNSLMQRAFTGELTAEWEAANAEQIAARQAFYERLPQLVLLAFLYEKARRSERKAIKATVLVTALMKYAFLLQMEGSSQRRFYQFIPYHYGPFAKELYTDLEVLQEQDIISIDNEEMEKTLISIAKPEKAEAALEDLPEELREDVATILNSYGDLDHNALLKTVYEKYPAYAKKSRLRTKRVAAMPKSGRGIKTKSTIRKPPARF